MSEPISKLGVFTSGGDAPGMNAAIRAVVRAAIFYKKETPDRKSTIEMGQLEAGESLYSVAGPLGQSARGNDNDQRRRDDVIKTEERGRRGLHRSAPFLFPGAP